MPSDVYFVALHDYARQQVDEIELKAGDIIRFLDDLENGWALGEVNGNSGAFPTNFVEIYRQKKNEKRRSRTRTVSSGSSKHSIKSDRSSIHFTPGGFDRYIKMMKNRPKRESTRRKPTRSFRIQKAKNSKLKWGENSWSFFEPWKSFRFKDKNQLSNLKRNSAAWTGSLTSILRNPSPDRKGYHSVDKK